MINYHNFLINKTNIMRKLTFITLCATYLFSTASFAQNMEEKQNILNSINQIAEYNATILGYADNCNYDKEDIKKVENYFLNTIQQININEEDLNPIRDNFKSTFNKAKVDGPGAKGMTCLTFEETFQQILNTVNNH